jgi:molybdopterin-containing oxidoreductase family iron-sulfur binding subunit
MNQNPSPDAPSQAGRAYWRGLDELAQTPEFQQWVEREFPEGASEWVDPVSRRHFLKIMSASFLLAGAGLSVTGCRRPEHKILPFSKMPENYVHGVPQYYATSMPAHGCAIPLVVRSNDGRPTKIEANDQHPEGSGTDRFTQASILNLYDPDRATSFKNKQAVSSPEAAFQALAGVARAAQANGGAGLSFLLESVDSPSRSRLEDEIRRKLPRSKWYLHDAVDLAIHRRTATRAFEKPVRPIFRYDKADVILSLDCDFLGVEPDLAASIRRFSQRRRINGPQDTPVRLYIAEALYTVTGMNADHRLRIPASVVPHLAGAVAAEILEGETRQLLTAIPKPNGVDPKWAVECAKDLSAHRGKCLIVAGHRQPEAVHLLAYAMNAALGNVGQTLLLRESPDRIYGGIADLTKALQAGAVETLVILGGNPAYTAPADLEWPKALVGAKNVIRLGYYEDETYPLCHWHLPESHYLESWGDTRTADGTVTPIQPLIAPLFGGVTELEVLARVGGLETTDPYAIVRKTFESTLSGGELDLEWRRFLHDGFLKDSAPQPVGVEFKGSELAQAVSAIKPSVPGKDVLELVFHLDYSVDDGRYNNNGWLQELPDPITKIVWDNAVLMSRKTAKDLGLKNSDVVEIRLSQRTIRGPVWVQPGQADYSIGLALGYGRERTGRVGRGTGFNAYALRTAGALSVATGASIHQVEGTYPISCTQTHWSMEGRPAVREANLEQYRKHPEFAKSMSLEHGEPKPMYPNPLDKLKPTALHQWGMAIDLNQCVGCSSCVIACQSENNVPIVGKDQVNRGREMHWLRIDRYYAGRPAGPKDSPQAKKNKLQTFTNEKDEQFEEWIDNPQVVTQPMLCQHCEAAPCENVCPVNATSHDQEGLNVMTYNRCVGTRYCSNNCPYKVRRFNFFDYNKRPIDKLYWGPLATRPDDEWDLIRMIKNPDVTVRMRGVMEKCTFCLQRIEQAKISQKAKAGSTPDVVVPDGTFTTACAQACPADAIVFGNLNDLQSDVSKRKASDRNYSVLEELFTRPRTTYLARVRNPNPAMPDYYEAPSTFQEYEQRMGDPLNKPHGKSAGDVHALEPAGAGHAEQKGGH